jgi:PAS domain S-box-containing protein
MVNLFRPSFANEEWGMIEDFRHRILREQIRLAMDQVPTMQGTSLIVALVLCYTVRDIVSYTNIFAWVALVLLIALGRIVLCRRFSKVRQGPFVGEPWEKAYLILALISGVIWGLSACMVFPAGNPALMSLFVLVMASLSAATTISHSSIRFAPTAWAGPAMLFYAARCVVEGGEYGYTVGFLIVLYLFTVLRYSFSHNSSVTSGIAIKFDNLKLLEEVQRVNQVLRQEIAERREAEDALRRSEANLQVIIEVTADGILAVDENGKAIKTNRRFAKLWRIPQSVMETGDDDEILNFVPHQLVDPDSFINKIKSLYGSSESDTGMLFFRDGRVFEHYSAPLVRDGCVAGRVWSFRDISHRKRMEETVRKSERFVRDVLNTLPAHIAIIENTGRIIEVNEAWKRFAAASGIAGNFDWTGVNYLSACEAAGPDEPGEGLTVSEGIRSVLRGRQDEFRFEYPCHFREEKRWFIMKTRRIEGDNRAVIMHDNITELKLAEASLRQSEERFRKVFEGGPLGMAIFGIDSQFIQLNSKLCEMLGCTEQDFWIKAFPDVMDPEYRSRDGSIIKSVLIKEFNFFETESRYVTGSGEMIWCHRTVSALKDEKGNTLYGLAVVEDVTKRKRIEKELEQHRCRLENMVSERTTELAVANKQLLEEIEQRKAVEEALRTRQRELDDLAAKLSENEETEKGHLALELHDRVGQNLSALNINLNLLKNMIPEGLDPRIDARIDDSAVLLKETAQCIRDVMMDLRPPVLDDYGLVAAVQWYSDRFRDRTGIEIVVEAEDIPRPPSQVETVLFRILQEALTNVARHASATNVRVNLVEVAKRIRMVIADNGIGFDPRNLSIRKTLPAWGLMGMRERAKRVGGELLIKSEPGISTKIIVTV